MWFWLFATGLALVVVLVMVTTMWRARGSEPRAGQSDSTNETSNVQVYRDQLDAVERDLARGTVTPEDAGRVRIEVSRRLLAADNASTTSPPAGRAPRALTLATIALVLVGVVGGTSWIYIDLGAPGYPDMGLNSRLARAAEARADRPSQATVEATQSAARQSAPANSGPTRKNAKYTVLMAKLRAAVKSRPDDLRGQTLLARNEARLGNFRAAYRAQGRVIALKAAKATGADYAEYANLLILGAQGYVSPEAETALKKALAIDPKNGTALYFSGLMFAQTGRPDITFRIWRDLLENSPASSPWTAPVRSQIKEISRLAGVKYNLPPAVVQTEQNNLQGPDAAAMAAASQMSDAERQKFIRSMVARLSRRLDSSGGSAAEWARLIGAYRVLGDKKSAAEAWTKAQVVFAGKDADLAAIRAAVDVATNAATNPVTNTVTNPAGVAN